MKRILSIFFAVPRPLRLQKLPSCKPSSPNCSAHDIFLKGSSHGRQQTRRGLGFGDKEIMPLVTSRALFWVVPSLNVKTQNGGERRSLEIAGQTKL